MYQCGMSPPKMSDELRSKRLNTTVTGKKMKAFTSKGAATFKIRLERYNDAEA
jgi:hypothetical protein